MADAGLGQVDEDELFVPDHDVVRVQVAVEDGVARGNGVDDRHQCVDLAVGAPAVQVTGVCAHEIADIGKGAFGHRGGV